MSLPFPFSYFLPAKPASPSSKSGRIGPFLSENGGEPTALDHPIPPTFLEIGQTPPVSGPKWGKPPVQVATRLMYGGFGGRDFARWLMYGT